MASKKKAKEVVEKPKKVKKTKRRSRPQQWMDAAGDGKSACDDAREAIAAMSDDQLSEAEKKQATENYAKAASAIEDNMNVLEDLRSSYEDWQSNLPESLQSSPVGEKLENVVGLDFSWTAPDSDDATDSDIDDAESMFDEAENADLPRGFGND